MRVAVVGAGIAGLSAARALAKRGIGSTLFEAEHRVGGRVATDRVGPYTFDSGASSITPRGRSLEAVMLRELDTTELLRVAAPISAHQGLRIVPGDPAMNRLERFTYATGNEVLPKLLAEGRDVRLNSPVEAIEPCGEGFLLRGEVFDAVVLTPPAPITRKLLASLGETRPMANARYRSCLSVLLGYARELSGVPYHALLDPEQRHPLTWLSIETTKAEGRAPAGHTAFVAQLSSEFSARNFEEDESRIVQIAVDFVERLYGKEWASPSASGLRRWRFSHPETTAQFERANVDSHRVVVAGDGLLGARVEYAFETGERAAEKLAAQLLGEKT